MMAAQVGYRGMIWGLAWSVRAGGCLERARFRQIGEGEEKMMLTFYTLAPVLQALLATLFTWFLTALGAVPVFFARNVNRKLLDSMLGMASGVMVAASFWSLLAPAIEMSNGSWVPAAVGFFVGRGGAARRRLYLATRPSRNTDGATGGHQDFLAP